MLPALLWVLVFVLSAQWVGRFHRRPAKAATSRPAATARFTNDLILWACFSIALFILLGSVVWTGPVQTTYFGRLAGRSPEPIADLAVQGLLYAGMAILFGWAAHVAVVVALATVTGDSAFLDRSPGQGIVDECSTRLHAAGWSSRTAL